MQKDVIYIDTEDDITAIIGKVKASKSKVVALVPPKRVGAIQSAVNLKLVHRAATQAGKHLAVVTNNQALTALAGSAGIPVAKNLESRPEMPEVAALEVDDEDIIDGGQLPVGERADAAAASGDPETISSAGTAAVVANDHKDTEPRSASAATAAKSRSKVPDFGSFRKKLFIGVAGLAALIALLVWAIVFAPQATIAITAKTTLSALNSKVTAGTGLATSLKDGTLKSELKTTTKDVSIPFTATGSKDVGAVATGKVTIAPTQQTIVNLALTAGSVTVQAGTAITSSGGKVYTTDQAATFSASNLPTTGSGITVGVTASASGTSYNGASGSATVSGGGFTATFSTSPSGGTDKTITVVQQSDIDTVSGNIVQSADSDAAKKALKSQFSGDYIIIDDTFKVDSSTVKPSPAVGAEATGGKAALAGKITYSIMAVSKTEVGKYLDAYFAQQVDGKANQKVYDNGLSTATFSASTPADDKYATTITANGKIGPNINENDVKQYVKGKKSGEIQAYLQAVNGVDKVDVSFSPFWVTGAPGDVNKIKVQFNVNG